MARDRLFAYKIYTALMSAEVCQQRCAADFQVSQSPEASSGKCELSYFAYKCKGMTEMKDIPSSFTNIYREKLCRGLLQPYGTMNHWVTG